jgi:hypothetical protein
MLGLLIQAKFQLCSISEHAVGICESAYRELNQAIDDSMVWFPV